MKWILALAAVVIVVGAIAVFGSFMVNDASPVLQETEDDIVVGLLMGPLRDERWVQDRDLFVKRAEELGANVVVLGAEDDAALQVRHAESMILQGVDIMVVVAVNTDVASAIVDKAHEAQIQVIAYDRLIKNEALDYYVSFDNVKVGQQQALKVVDVAGSGTYAYIGGSPTDNNAFLVKEGAMKVLQPLIDDGTITLALDTFSEGWKQEVAYKNMSDYLAEHGTIDAVVAANDSTAAGVIQALGEYGLAGTVPVSGQDASLGAVRKIVSGEQTVTIYKPIRDLAYKAAEMAVAVVRGEDVEINNSIENGSVMTPAYLLDVVAVTKDNIDETIIKDRFHERSEVYPGL